MPTTKRNPQPSRCDRCDGPHPTTQCPYPGPTPLLSRLMGQLQGGAR